MPENYKHDNLISLLSLDPEKGLSIYDDSEVKIIGRVTEVRRKL
jgi:phage repressor protein C with HTH and peptisase S24 domain